MDSRHERFMREALAVAREGLDRGELPIGAVVVLGGHIIASAHTQEVAQSRLLVHADLLALEAADRLRPFPGRRRDCTLYVTGEPCLMCLGAAMSFFVGEIVYGHEMPSDGAVSGAGLDEAGARLPELSGAQDHGWPAAAGGHRPVPGLRCAPLVGRNVGVGEDGGGAVSDILNTHQSNIPEFGDRKPGQRYDPRPGAYALIFDARGRIAVMETPRGCFLPGGGSECGETPEETLVREVREECGCEVAVVGRLGEAVEYVHTAGNDMGIRKECVFFAAILGVSSAVATEDDHTLIWLEPYDAERRLAHGSQRWAVGEVSRH